MNNVFFDPKFSEKRNIIPKYIFNSSFFDPRQLFHEFLTISLGNTKY